MTLDSRRFPRAAQYVAELPDGLDSYPECRVKTARHEDACAQFGDLFTGDGVPPAIARLVAGEHKEEWLSDVVGSTFSLMLRDVAFADDEAFFNWSYDNTTKLYSRPLFRVVMFILSPTLVIMNAAKKWQVFHEGSDLYAGKAVPVGSRMVTDGKLTFPPHLFNQLLVRQFGQSFCAAVACAGAKNPRAELNNFSSTEAVQRVSWDG